MLFCCLPWPRTRANRGTLSHCMCYAYCSCTSHPHTKLYSSHSFCDDDPSSISIVDGILHDVLPLLLQSAPSLFHLPFTGQPLSSGEAREVTPRKVRVTKLVEIKMSPPYSCSSSWVPPKWHVIIVWSLQGVQRQAVSFTYINATCTGLIDTVTGMRPFFFFLWLFSSKFCAVLRNPSLYLWAHVILFSEINIGHWNNTQIICCHFER